MTATSTSVTAKRTFPPDTLAVFVAAVHAGILAFQTRAGRSVAPDALEYAAVARNLTRGAGYTIDFVEIHPGLLPSIRHLHEMHGLLQPLLIAPLFALWGPSLTLLRYPGIAFLAGTALATFYLAAHAFDRASAWAAFAVVLVAQFMTLDALLGGDDIGWTFFSTLALLGFAKVLTSSRPRWLVLASVASALAAAMKVTGVTLPMAFGAVLLAAPRLRKSVDARKIIALVVPTVAVVCLYLIRNHALHGKFGFRYSALDWYWKDDYRRYFAYFKRTPTMLRVFQEFGPARMIQITLNQFRLLGVTAIRDPLVLIGGSAALVLHAKRGTTFGFLGVAHCVLIAALVCVAYHVEPRYLLALHPVCTVALVGALAPLVESVARRIGTVATRAAVLCGVALLITSATKLYAFVGAASAAAKGAGLCDDALRFMTRHVGRNEAVLTADPWSFNFLSDRRAVNIPSNGTDATVEVARHYGARWAIDGLGAMRPGNAYETLRPLTLRDEPPWAEQVFSGSLCNVYRLHLGAD